MRSYLTIVFLPCMLSFQQCDEPLTELEKLPPATQSGNRTFGCLVDGKAWVIEGITDVQAYYQTGTFFVSAGVLNKNFNSIIQIHIDNVNLEEQLYQLTEKINQPGSQDARYYDHRATCEFVTTSTYTGSITITNFDNVNFIISGTFEFDAYSSDCTKIVKITDGRFDIYYAASLDLADQVRLAESLKTLTV